MYLRVEENIVVNTKDIIGIFDMDNTTVSRLAHMALTHERHFARYFCRDSGNIPMRYLLHNQKRRDSCLGMPSKIGYNRSSLRWRACCEVRHAAAWVRREHR